MDLNLSVDREVRVTMTYYLKKIISYFPDQIQVRVATPVVEHLFTVREVTNRNMLDEYRATEFHHSVAQLLFATPRVRKNIQTYVALLTTGVRNPDEDEWRKL